MESVAGDAIQRGDLVSLRDGSNDLLGIVVERGSTWLALHVTGWGKYYRFDHQVQKV